MNKNTIRKRRKGTREDEVEKEKKRKGKRKRTEPHNFAHKSTLHIFWLTKENKKRPGARRSACQTPCLLEGVCCGTFFLYIYVDGIRLSYFFLKKNEKRERRSEVKEKERRRGFCGISFHLIFNLHRLSTECFSFRVFHAVCMNFHALPRIIFLPQQTGDNTALAENTPSRCLCISQILTSFSSRCVLLSFCTPSPFRALL